MASKFVCAIDQRRFKTKAGLAAHTAALHPQPTSGSNRRRRRAGAAATAAPLSLPTTNQTGGGNTQNLVVQGKEQLTSHKLKVGDTSPFSMRITPTVTPRLAAHASAYQRIRYEMVRLQITPLNAAIVNGGYVAGFVADPEDDGLTATTLASHQGSVIRKNWETALVTAAGFRFQEYYTSEGEHPDLRWFSPGTFWLIPEAASSSEISFAITLHWKVRLSVPSAEKPVRVSSDITFMESGWPSPGYHQIRGKGGKKQAKQIITGLPPDKSGIYIYLLTAGVDIEYKEGEGDTGTARYFHLMYDSDQFELTWMSEPGDSKSAYPWQSNVEERMIIPAGAIAVLLKAPGNPSVRSRQLRGLVSSNDNGANLPGASASKTDTSKESLARSPLDLTLLRIESQQWSLVSVVERLGRDFSQSLERLMEFQQKLVELIGQGSSQFQKSQEPPP